MTVIDFRTTQQVFYGGSEIKEVWYQGQKVWEKVQERVEAIFQAEIPITKMGNAIMMNFGHSAWRDGRPEAIDGKMIRFTTGSTSYDYTIQLADAQATTMSLMFTTQPIDLQSGMVYRIEILGDVSTTSQTVEWETLFDGTLNYYGTVVTSEPNRYARFMIVNGSGLEHEFVMTTEQETIRLGYTEYFVRQTSNRLIVGGGSGKTIIKGLPR